MRATSNMISRQQQALSCVPFLMLALVGKSFQVSPGPIPLWRYGPQGKQSQVPADPSTSEVLVWRQRKRLRQWCMGPPAQDKGDSWCPQLSNSVAWKTICRPGNHDSVKCGSATKEWELPGRIILPPIPPYLPAATSTLPLISRFSQALQRIPSVHTASNPTQFPQLQPNKGILLFLNSPINRKMM